jgi:hypothetical protein
MANDFRNSAVEAKPEAPYNASDSDEGEIGRAFKRLDELGSLENNWDSSGSEPPAVEAIIKARNLIDSVYRTLWATAGQNVIPFAIAPLSGGGIQIEWRSRRGAIEVEIGPTTLGYLLIKGTGTDRTFLKEEGVSEARILELISSIVVE